MCLRKVTQNVEEIVVPEYYEFFWRGNYLIWYLVLGYFFDENFLFYLDEITSHEREDGQSSFGSQYKSQLEITTTFNDSRNVSPLSNTQIFEMLKN